MHVPHFITSKRYFSVFRQTRLGFNYTRAQKVKELAVCAACKECDKNAKFNSYIGQNRVCWFLSLALQPLTQDLRQLSSHLCKSSSDEERNKLLAIIGYIVLAHLKR